MDLMQTELPRECCLWSLCAQAMSECVIIYDWDDFDTGYFTSSQLPRVHAASNTHTLDHITEMD